MGSQFKRFSFDVECVCSDGERLKLRDCGGAAERGTKVNEIEVSEMYSATYDWLVLFAEFCRKSGGFKVH